MNRIDSASHHPKQKDDGFFVTGKEAILSFDQTKWVWTNGQLVGWGSATVHVSAHALHYGSGVFEGIRCYETENGPAVFRMDAHLDRMFASAAAYHLPIPYSKEEIEEAICDTILKNEF